VKEEEEEEEEEQRRRRRWEREGRGGVVGTDGENSRRLGVAGGRKGRREWLMMSGSLYEGPPSTTRFTMYPPCPPRLNVRPMPTILDCEQGGLGISIKRHPSGRCWSGIPEFLLMWSESTIQKKVGNPLGLCACQRSDSIAAVTIGKSPS
jgi:hypothetical protein